MNQRNQKWQVPHFVWAFGYHQSSNWSSEVGWKWQLKCNTAGDFFWGSENQVPWKIGEWSSLFKWPFGVYGIPKTSKNGIHHFQTHPYIIHITVRPTDRLLLRIAELSLETLEKWSQHVSTHWTRDSIHCRNSTDVPSTEHGQVQVGTADWENPAIIEAGIHKPLQ